MAKSDTILGRRMNQVAFRRKRHFRVSAYFTRRGQLRYTDPVESSAKNTVLYRIIVKPFNLPRSISQY